MTLETIIDLAFYPITDEQFRQSCRDRYEADGILVLENFLIKTAIAQIRAEGIANRNKVYAKTEQHTVYLSPQDLELPQDHARNRLVTSSKGCLTDDLIAEDSPLRGLYNSPDFRNFLCHIVGEQELFAYADPLSSINLHFAETGQELGWHFDNSSFAITLMIEPPVKGGQFEYVPAVRDADSGDMGYDAVDAILDGKTPVTSLTATAGTLVIFKGRNAMHRVAPNEGDQTRMLAVLAYNSEAGISLSKEAQQTFYGRTA